MILYIHGFASGKKSNKVMLLKQRFEKVVAIDLSAQPNKALNQLQSFIEQHMDKEKITLIGSSLGGFYAIKLSAKYNLKAILINPAIKPWKTLEKYANKEIENYSTKEHFTFHSSYLQELKELQTKCIDTSKILLLLQTGDDVLDYREALEFLPNTKFIITSGGSHQFENFEDYTDIIKRFINKKD